MSAQAILAAAYEAGVVPTHLYGRTQHKTLQARLSEDILHRREASAFYRTEPGHFFLVELLPDPDIPKDWKTPFPARRRIRDLKRNNTLSVRKSFVSRWKRKRTVFESFFEHAAAENAMAYLHPDEMEQRGYCSTWTFSLVLRKDHALAYRIGRYRDNRDAFANKRSIGFPGALTADDLSLFSRADLGAAQCAVSVLSHDLDLSRSVFDSPETEYPAIERLLIIESDTRDFDLVIVLVWPCPDWFEPTTKRLSLNDLQWLNTTARHNDLSDFEPWSSKLLTELPSFL